MELVRSWLGQALRATGAAVVVPVAILVALSVSALGGGGLGGLGALSQIVAGPAVAGSGVSVDDGDSEIADAVAALAASDRVATRGSDPLSGGGVPAPQTPNGAGAPGSPSPPPGGDDEPGSGGPPERSPPGGGDPDPPPGAAPPRPPDPPGVIEGIGGEVKDATSGTPVAPTVEDAVDGLVETCGRLGCP